MYMLIECNRIVTERQQLDVFVPKIRLSVLWQESAMVWIITYTGSKSPSCIILNIVYNPKLFKNNNIYIQLFKLYLYII